MNEWMRNIAGYLILVSVTMQILPNKKYEQYVKVFTGFLLILLLAKPMLKIGRMDEVLEQKVTQLIEEQEKLEEDIVQQGEIFLKDQAVTEIKEIEKIRIEVSDEIQP